MTLCKLPLLQLSIIVHCFKVFAQNSKKTPLIDMKSGTHIENMTANKSYIERVCAESE